jgi:hypothetical protein
MGIRTALEILPAPVLRRLVDGRSRRPRRSARRYIDPDLGVEEFFSLLNTAHADYVCLRWHDELPRVREGEDIDLLVSDDDLQTAAALLTGKKQGGVAVDLYTVSGLPGTDYCTVPYFMPDLARSALQRARLHNGLVRIPDPASHFYTMCYHVVYHKGLASGLPERDAEESRPTADHDYAAAISDLAKAAGLPVPELTLFGLNEVLEQSGWKPATDMLRKYARKNPWLQYVIGATDAPCDPDLDGLAVFLVRERASGQTEEITKFLEKEGFAVLETLVLDPEGARRAAARIRGGNWSCGPWPVSGGPPAVVIAAFDCFPCMEHLAESPCEYHNVRIQRAKVRLRRHLMTPVPESEAYNPLHSSDTPQEALEYLRLIDRGLHDRTCESAKPLSRESRHPFAVKHRMDGHGRRAKVEVIEYNGGLAVCKTFRPGAARFLQRELLARELAPRDGGISALLEVGPNYFVTEYVQGDERQLSRLRPLFADEKFLPVWAILQCRQLIKAFRSRGYELIDFTPQNMIFDRRGGLKFIDFEFLQAGPAATESLEGNFAWWLPPPGFSGDYPERTQRGDPYAMLWRARTGVPRFVCARASSPALLYAAQLLGWLVLSAANARRAASQNARQKFSKSRRGR